MCKGKVLYDEQKDKMDKKVKTTSNSNGATKADHSEETKHDGSHSQRVRRRRQKREKKGVEFVDYIVKKKQSKLKAKHGEKSGGVEALLPSLGVLGVLGFGLMARMGFRGRISVAGIDLGTTNSVICIQAQTSGVGKITCIPDPINNSSLIPSVASFLPRDDEHYHPPSSQSKHNLDSFVLVGHAAKQRIDMHPQSTFYHAKRFLGRQYHSSTVQDLKQEVEFAVVPYSTENAEGGVDPPFVDGGDSDAGVNFHVPTGFPLLESSTKSSSSNTVSKFRLRDPSGLKHYLSPERVGSYVVKHLLHLASVYLGYDHITSAVIAVPAKFTPMQRAATARAFQMAGLKVTRVLEEPTAAALAYGLQHKSDVNFILVYDFGGGTLDVSVLQVSKGYVEVMASEGDDTLGGADFDSAIAHYLLPEGDHKDRNNTLVMHTAHVTEMLELLARMHYGRDNPVSHQDIIQIEESFADHCARTEQIPLCHGASFHSLGEQLKIQLSTSDVAEVECLSLSEIDLKRISATADTISSATNEVCHALFPTTLSMSLQQFHEAVSHLYERSLLPIRRVLKVLDLTTEDIDEVVMVGGTTRMPMIRELVREELKVKSLNIDIDPDITVAYGAASVID